MKNMILLSIDDVFCGGASGEETRKRKWFHFHRRFDTGLRRRNAGFLPGDVRSRMGTGSGVPPNKIRELLVG